MYLGKYLSQSRETQQWWWTTKEEKEVWNTKKEDYKSKGIHMINLLIYYLFVNMVIGPWYNQKRWITPSIFRTIGFFLLFKYFLLKGWIGGGRKWCCNCGWQKFSWISWWLFKLPNHRRHQSPSQQARSEISLSNPSEDLWSCFWWGGSHRPSQ